MGLGSLCVTGVGAIWLREFGGGAIARAAGCFGLWSGCGTSEIRVADGIGDGSDWDA